MLRNNDYWLYCASGPIWGKWWWRCGEVKEANAFRRLQAAPHATLPSSSPTPHPQAVLQSDSDMARAVQEYQRALVTAQGNVTKVGQAAP